MLRTRLLEVAAAQFSAGNLGRDRQHGHAIAMTIVQSVDQMKIAWTTTASTHGEFAGEMGLGACGSNGVCSFVAYSSGHGEEVRSALAACVVQHGWGLLEVKPMALSLEDLFMRLVTKEERV